MIIPNIWENKFHGPNHQPAMLLGTQNEDFGAVPIRRQGKSLGSSLPAVQLLEIQNLIAVQAPKMSRRSFIHHVLEGMKNVWDCYESSSFADENPQIRMIFFGWKNPTAQHDTPQNAQPGLSQRYPSLRW